jgi:hypothetical protein
LGENARVHHVAQSIWIPWRFTQFSGAVVIDKFGYKEWPRS